MVKCVSILGSTGSIGRQTLDIIDNLNIPVAALTAGSNAQRMAEQCRKYTPKLAVMSTEKAAKELKEAIADLPTEVMWGEAGLIAAATISEADCIITACPLCRYNLIKAESTLPVIYFTELLAEALGVK